MSITRIFQNMLKDSLLSFTKNPLRCRMVTMVKMDINSVEVHPRLSHKGRPSSGWGGLVGAGSLWPQTMVLLEGPKVLASL
jgi:hypothetical protein